MENIEFKSKESEQNISHNITNEALQEIKLTNINKNENEAKDYEFQVISNINSFPNIFNKDTMKLLEKWGLTHIELVKFRFNLNFNPLEINKFLLDLFNSPIVKKQVPGISSVVSFSGNDIVNKLSFSKLTTESVNLDILDVVYENKLVNKETGYIKKDFEEIYEGIVLADKLKRALVDPEDENYCIFDEKTRNEFLFKVFMHICVGGSLNQYEDYAGEYFNLTKIFYKDLISVTKNTELNKLVVRSHAYKILKLNDKDIFKNPYNPQNFIYVIVDPYQKMVNIWYNKWENFW
jgi:hypothetical protein